MITNTWLAMGPMGDSQESEKSYLLSEDADNKTYTEKETVVSLQGEETTVSPIGPDELPPPFFQNSEGGTGVPKVTCRVCQAMIDISVVKCSQCNEATPICNAPPGKDYVRCPCNCILICKSSSQRIACPRPNCKRIINIARSPVTPPVPGMCRVTCGHCHDTFLFNTLNNSLARCPHCRKVSSVGPDYAKGRSNMFLIVAAVCLAFGLGISAGTFSYDQTHVGMYVLYSADRLIALVMLGKCIYESMKVSVVEEQRGKKL